MKHKNFSTRAEILRAAADSIEMQEKAGVAPYFRYENSEWCIYVESALLFYNQSSIEFPLAVVEGKHVWEGDELWLLATGEKVTAGQYPISLILATGSWNPPKPKTVMVELLVEDVENLANHCTRVGASSERVYQACRKALEELK